MVSKSDDVALKKNLVAAVKQARSKPVNFAYLPGKDSPVFETSLTKSASALWTVARKQAGGGKGAYGGMKFTSGKLILRCEEDPPGALHRSFKSFLQEQGQTIKFAFAGPGEDPETAGDEEEPPAASGGARKNGAAAEAPAAAGAALADDPATAEAGAEDEDGGEEDDDTLLGEDLGLLIKKARKRPLNAAWMLAKEGLVLRAHPRLPVETMLREAKAAGADPRGALGVLTVSGKDLTLACQEAPPGAFPQQAKKWLAGQGYPFKVYITLPDGTGLDSDAEGAEAGSGPGAAGAGGVGGASAGRPAGAGAHPEGGTATTTAGLTPVADGPETTPDHDALLAEMETRLTAVQDQLHPQQRKALNGLLTVAKNADNPLNAGKAIKVLENKVNNLKLPMNRGQAQGAAPGRVSLDQLPDGAARLLKAGGGTATVTEAEAAELAPYDPLLGAVPDADFQKFFGPQVRAPIAALPPAPEDAFKPTPPDDGFMQRAREFLASQKGTWTGRAQAVGGWAMDMVGGVATIGETIYDGAVTGIEEATGWIDDDYAAEQKQDLIDRADGLVSAAEELISDPVAVAEAFAASYEARFEAATALENAYRSGHADISAYEEACRMREEAAAELAILGIETAATVIGVGAIAKGLRAGKMAGSLARLSPLALAMAATQKAKQVTQAVKTLVAKPGRKRRFTKDDLNAEVEGNISNAPKGTGRNPDGFSGVEVGIIDEAVGILSSSQMNTIRQAHGRGESVTVVVNGRTIQYEPDLPASGMTMFGEDGFLIGREAFTNPGELDRTVLHELHRLRTSQSSAGVSGSLATNETQAAFDFANRAFEAMNP